MEMNIPWRCGERNGNQEIIVNRFEGADGGDDTDGMGEKATFESSPCERENFDLILFMRASQRWSSGSMATNGANVVCSNETNRK